MADADLAAIRQFGHTRDGGRALARRITISPP